MLTRLRDRLATVSAFAFFVLATAPAYATGSSMPWEQPLTAGGWFRAAGRIR